MDTPNSSDYIEIKKRKQMSIHCPLNNASNYTKNKQYLTIQTTPTCNEDGYLTASSNRFQIELPKQDLATYFYFPRKIWKDNT